MGADTEGLSTLEEGLSSLTLYCKGDGNPKPNVWWTKDGQRIITDGPNLIIVTVTRNDSGIKTIVQNWFKTLTYFKCFKILRRSKYFFFSGIYKCLAKNAMGKSDSVKIEIDVKCK